MADWTNLPNTAVGVGGLPSGTTVTALRDNVGAAIQSAPGAPRPVTIENYFSRGSTNLLSGLAAGDLVLPLEAFTGFFTDTTTGSTSFVSAGTVTITNRATGTLRFNASQSSDFPSGVRIELRKNGTSVFNAVAQNASQSVDVAASSGDVFEWFVRRESSASFATINNFSIRANDTVQAFGIIAKRSEVI
jgi:hypothetical protein